MVSRQDLMQYATSIASTKQQIEEKKSSISEQQKLAEQQQAILKQQQTGLGAAGILRRLTQALQPKRNVLLEQLGQKKSQISDIQKELQAAGQEVTTFETQTLQPAEQQLQQAQAEQAEWEAAYNIAGTNIPSTQYNKSLQEKVDEIRRSQSSERQYNIDVKKIEEWQKANPTEKLIYDKFKNITAIQSGELGRTVSFDEYNKLAEQSQKQSQWVTQEQLKPNQRLYTKSEYPITIKGDTIITSAIPTGTQIRPEDVYKQKLDTTKITPYDTQVKPISILNLEFIQPSREIPQMKTIGGGEFISPETKMTVGETIEFIGEIPSSVGAAVSKVFKDQQSIIPTYEVPMKRTIGGGEVKFAEQRDLPVKFAVEYGLYSIPIARDIFLGASFISGSARAQDITKTREERIGGGVQAVLSGAGLAFDLGRYLKSTKPIQPKSEDIEVSVSRVSTPEAKTKYFKLTRDINEVTGLKKATDFRIYETTTTNLRTGVKTKYLTFETGKLIGGEVLEGSRKLFTYKLNDLGRPISSVKIRSIGAERSGVDTTEILTETFISKKVPWYKQLTGEAKEDITYLQTGEKIKTIKYEKVNLINPLTKKTTQFVKGITPSGKEFMLKVKTTPAKTIRSFEEGLTKTLQTKKITADEISRITSGKPEFDEMIFQKAMKKGTSPITSSGGRFYNPKTIKIDLTRGTGQIKGLEKGYIISEPFKKVKYAGGVYKGPEIIKATVVDTETLYKLVETDLIPKSSKVSSKFISFQKALLKDTRAKTSLLPKSFDKALQDQELMIQQSLQQNRLALGTIKKIVGTAELITTPQVKTGGFLIGAAGTKIKFGDFMAKEALKFNAATKIDLKLGTETGMKMKTLDIQKINFLQTTIPQTKVFEIQMPLQREVQVQVQVQKLQQRQIQKSTPSQPTFTSPPPTPPPFLGFKLPKQKRKPFKPIKKIIAGPVIPYGRRYGKFQPLAKPTSVERAKAIGFSFLKGTLGATVEIRKPTGERIPIAFKSREYRPGKRGKDIFQIVQRAPFRLGTRAEVSEIISLRRRK